MSGQPTTEGDQHEGGARGIGDDDGGHMNEGDMEYQQEQAGFAELTDPHGNPFLVSMEDLAAVGVDINRELEINEEQYRLLLSSSSQEDNMHPGSMKEDDYEDAGDPVTITVLPDGGIKLTAVGGHESFFSPSQLGEINIDTQNLTDDDIKRIVQLAHAATGEVLYDDMMERPDKRRKMDSNGVGGGMEERRDAQRMQPLQRNYQSIHASSHSTASTSSGHVPGPSSNLARNMSNGGRRAPPPIHNVVHNGLIGESVKIQNAKGKIVSAVVRYSRPGNGVQTAAYKVQTADGKFEWIHPDRIIDRAPRMIIEPREYDHKGYISEHAPSHQPTAPSTSSSSGGQVMVSRRVLPPSTPVGGGGGGGAVMQRQPQLIQRQSQPAPHQHPPPNFCCPVCDRKVYQKEPAYIVIRLPACDTCTREKILIVDETTRGEGEEGGGGVETSTSAARPATRSIATDTADLLTEMDKRSQEIPSTTSPEEEAARGEEEIVEKSVEETETSSMEESPLVG